MNQQERPKFNSIEDLKKVTKTNTRQEQRFQKLGTAKPVCAVCGYAKPEGMVTTNSSLLEAHHLAGRHEGITVLLCRNCHAELSEKQRDWPEETMKSSRTPLLTLSAFLQGVGEFLIHLGQHLIEWAKWLLDFDSHVDDEVYSTAPSAPIHGQ